MKLIGDCKNNFLSTDHTDNDVILVRKQIRNCQQWGTFNLLELGLALRRLI